MYDTHILKTIGSYMHVTSVEVFVNGIKIFNQQKLFMIALLFSSECLECLS